MGKLRVKEKVIRKLLTKAWSALDRVVSDECALQDESKRYSENQLNEWVDLLSDINKEIK